MALKTSVTAKFNYTGRKKIPLRPDTINIEISERNTESLVISLDINPQQILQAARLSTEAPMKLVVDAFYRGNIHRIMLPKNKTRQRETISDCPDQVNPTFRLMVISDDENQRGKILAATTFFGASENTGNAQSGTKPNAFFIIKRSDTMGDNMWNVDWNDINNPRINVNGRVLDKGYTDQNKQLRAFVFPSILREILTGLVFRIEDLNDLPESSNICNWKAFFEQRLDVDFNELTEDADPQTKLDFIDKGIMAFVQQKWGHGKTLLDELAGE